MVEVRGLAFARAVEVDDVQVARAGFDERAGGLERVVGVDGLVLEAPLAQPDGLAVADVDRRQQDHAATDAPARQRAAKLRSSRRPSGPDFSGWNWVP
jgi:hypothetical protein